MTAITQQSASFVDVVLRRLSELNECIAGEPWAPHIRQAITEALAEAEPVGYINDISLEKLRGGARMTSAIVKLPEYGYSPLFTAPQLDNRDAEIVRLREELEALRVTQQIEVSTPYRC